jgi:CubicO group peptidase (beta-lactamase class C family)
MQISRKVAPGQKGAKKLLYQFRITLCVVLLTSNICSQDKSVINSGASVDDSSNLQTKLANIEKAIEEKRQNLNIPGAALVIVKDDRVIFLKGFGFRDVEAKLPVTPETLFAVGSITKTFTALATVISADEGKLSLDDSPKKFLPWFKLRDPEADAQVTLRDMLSHRTGLKAYGGDNLWMDSNRTRDEIIRITMQSKPKAKFREKCLYSNVMYLAAGEAIAKSQNTTWEELITSRILKPLDLSATNLSIAEMQRSTNFSYGYRQGKNPERVLMRNQENIAPAGAVNSNAIEMGRWLRFLLGGGAIDGKRLVSEKGFQELMAKQIDVDDLHYYGLGMGAAELPNWRGHPIYNHSGAVRGFSAIYAFIPDQRLGFALLTNTQDSKLVEPCAGIVLRNLVNVK